MQIAATVLEGWFRKNKISSPDRKISFGNYALSLDEGVLLVKNTKKARIDLMNWKRLGLEGEISDGGKLIRSEIKEISKESGNAGFFILDDGWKAAVYVSLSYSKDETNVRTTEYKLGFALSNDWWASAKDGSIIVIDRKAGRYALLMADGRTLSAPIKFKPRAKCFMVSREIAAMANLDEAHITHNGLRDLIEIKELEEANGSPLDEPEATHGELEGIEWLAIRNRDWKKKALLVALNGKNSFLHCFCEIQE